LRRFTSSERDASLDAIDIPMGRCHFAQPQLTPSSAQQDGRAAATHTSTTASVRRAALEQPQAARGSHAMMPSPEEASMIFRSALLPHEPPLSSLCDGYNTTLPLR